MRRVTAGDGSTWLVGRRVAIWRPRLVDRLAAGGRRVAADPTIGGDPNLAGAHRLAVRGQALGHLAAITAVAAALEIAAALVASPVWLPVFLFERFWGRKPWVVVARRRGSRSVHAWAVHGWSASARVIRELVDDLAHQRTPSPQAAVRDGVATKLDR